MRNVNELLHIIDSVMEKYDCDRRYDGWNVEAMYYDWSQFDRACTAYLDNIPLRHFLSSLQWEKERDTFEAFHECCMLNHERFVDIVVEMAQMKLKALLTEVNA